MATIVIKASSIERVLTSESDVHILYKSGQKDWYSMENEEDADKLATYCNAAMLKSGRNQEECVFGGEFVLVDFGDVQSMPDLPKQYEILIAP